MPKFLALSERQRRNWPGNGTDYEVQMRFGFWVLVLRNSMQPVRINPARGSQTEVC